MKPIKISFDFDSTLSRKTIQQFAKYLIENGIEVWICTSRFSNGLDEEGKNWNEDLFMVADQLKIPKERIIFTEWQDKYLFIKDKNFLIHLDDDCVELDGINKYTKTKGISVENTSQWKHKVLKLLKWKN